MAIMAISMSAQNDVTTFLGIPVDGFKSEMKPVWFRICESYGEYYITMFYDNEYNHANGEDL